MVGVNPSQPPAALSDNKADYVQGSLAEPPHACLHTWPELENIPTHAQSTVAATSSTSSNTSIALLPPSSRWTSVGPAFAAFSITLCARVP